MSQTAVTGRHRAPGRHNPLTEITGMVARVGESGVKASAVLAASGGLVAAFALPAQAATATTTTTTRAAAAKPLASKPVAAKTATTAAALVAPQAAAPAKLATVGVVGVSAVEKPAPAPEPVVVPAPVEQVSRSATRTATTAAPAQDAAPAATAAPRQPASGSILDIARSLLGIPYVYGGTTPAGFDCSGFTQYVYGHAGISIPRTATAQMNASTIVSNPQPGDLVFVVSGGVASHVGIYTGPGMMIDSPRTGKSTSERSIWASNVVYGRF